MASGTTASTTLSDALLILSTYGLRRCLPLLAAMLLAGLLEGIGVASLFPLLAMVTESSAEPSKLQKAIEDGAALLHVPLNLELLCILIAGTIAAKAAINLIVARRLGRAGAAVAHDLRERLLTALMAAKWSYFTVQPVGRFIAAATTEANWASVAFRSALRAIEQVARTAVFCGLAIVMGWQMAVIAIGMGIVMALALRFLTRAARMAGRARTSAMARLIQEFSDALVGFKPLKAMNRQAHLVAELTKDARELRTAMSALTRNQSLLSEFPDLLQILLFCAAGYLAARVFAAPVDYIVVAGVVSLATMTSIIRVRRALTTLAQADSAYDSLQDTIAEIEASAETLTGSTAPTLETGCELRDVTFSYGREAVLSRVNLRIPVHRTTALVGPSGAGKTTIADLLLGLYRPAGGKVLIDGVDLGVIDIAKWRSMVGYVSQEIVLFNDTIFANIALGDDGITEEDVTAAVEAAGLSDLVADRAKGLGSLIGERGFQLSGGQRQRLALARALVHKPKLLILDEVTSALDPETEEAICATISSRTREFTVFVITHQPSWIRRADVVYLAGNGGIREIMAEEIAAFESGRACATPRQHRLGLFRSSTSAECPLASSRRIDA